MKLTMRCMSRGWLKQKMLTSNGAKNIPKSRQRHQQTEKRNNPAPLAHLGGAFMHWRAATILAVDYLAGGAPGPSLLGTGDDGNRTTLRDQGGVQQSIWGRCQISIPGQ